MRITQGTFSFLPDLTDAEIARADRLRACSNGWAVSVEHTDEPHPRNVYWEMWGMPMFDLKDAAGAMLEVERLPQDVPEPLHQGQRVRLDAGLGIDAAVVHRQSPAARAGLPRRPPGGPGPRDPLHDRELRRRRGPKAAATEPTPAP